MKRNSKLLVLPFVFTLVAAACGDDGDDAGTTATTAGDTTAPPTTAEATTAPPTTATATTPAPAAADVTPVKTCLVTDLAGIDDRSFNASAWKGVQDAEAAGFAVDIQFSESDSAEDWQPNSDVLLEQGCEHMVTVGFALGPVTEINAQAYPDITWTIVDVDFLEFDANFNFDGDTEYPNARELVYQTDEAAFLAGYLAAGVSTTGVLGTYGGGNFPTVSIFMDGFTRGAQHYNDVKGTSVSVLGWRVDDADGIFTGSFTDMDLARNTAESLFDEGVDIIIPVGGAINLPAGDAIIARGLDAALIGVDADAFFSMPEQYQDLWLVTVEKGIAKTVFESIMAHAAGTWTPGKVVGTLVNGDVGLSPYHSWEDRISAELAAEVEAHADDIRSGALNAAFTPVT